jgi:hypothetical protein
MNNVLVVYKYGSKDRVRVCVDGELAQPYVNLFELANNKYVDDVIKPSENEKLVIDFVTRFVEASIDADDVLSDAASPPSVTTICTTGYLYM